MASKQLQAHVETLYRAFARYSPGKTPALCMYCTDKEQHEADERLRAPLRELTRDISSLNFGGHGYGGDDSERLRFFLPRLLELAVSRETRRFLDLSQLETDMENAQWANTCALRGRVQQRLRALRRFKISR
jgi:hypothetical protein